MKPKSQTSRAWRPCFPARPLVAAAFVAFGFAAGALAQPRYSLTDAGSLPGLGPITLDCLGGAGDAAGAAGPDSFHQQAVAWRKGRLVPLGRLPGGTYSYATAMNLAGTVVGDGDTGDGRPQSWVATPAGLVNLFPNNGGNTHVVGINNAGTICGYYTKSLSGNTASWKGALWMPDPKAAGRYREADLPSLPGNNNKFTSAIPFAFNQRGEAAGWAVNDVIGQHASFWNSDAAHSIVDLGVYPGDGSSIAWGMNDLGQVVGESHPAGGTRPVLWSNDAARTPLALPLLAGDGYGAATRINNLGQVLGFSGPVDPSTGAPAASRLVLWSDGGVFAVQNLLDGSGAGWTITAVGAIDDLGRIAATGVHNGETRGVLLTPVNAVPVLTAAPAAN